MLRLPSSGEIPRDTPPEEARSARRSIVRPNGPPLPAEGVELAERALDTPHLYVVEYRPKGKGYKAAALGVYDGTMGIGPATEALALSWISTPYSGGWRLMAVHRRRHGELRAHPVLLPDTPESAIADFFSLMESP